MSTTLPSLFSAAHYPAMHHCALLHNASLYLLLQSNQNNVMFEKGVVTVKQELKDEQ